MAAVKTESADGFVAHNYITDTQPIRRSATVQNVHVSQVASRLEEFTRDIQLAWPESSRYVSSSLDCGACYESIRRTFGRAGQQRFPEDDMRAIEKEAALIRNIKRNLASALGHAEANLKIRRGSLCMTNRLPRDVLLHIFQFAAQMPAEHDQIGNTMINISQTCAYWREITIRNPFLWTVMDFSTLTASEAALMVSRSDTLPLRIRTTYWDQMVPWCLDSEDSLGNIHTEPPLLQGVLARTETLEICSNGKPSRVPAWLYECRAPKLRHLDITFTEDPAPRTAVRAVLENDIQRLHSLVLKRLFIPWSLIATASPLTKLHLDFSSRIKSSKYQSEDATILQVLRSCRKIRDLSLTCHDPLRDLPPLPEDPITLSNLHSFELDMTPRNLKFMLKAVATPHSLQFLRFTCQLNPHTEDKDRILKLPADPRCLPSINKLQVFRLRSRNIDGSIERQAPPASFNLCLKSCAKSGDRRKATVATFLTIAKRYPMHHIRELHITMDVSSVLDDVIFFVSNSLRLESLWIGGNCPGEALLQKLTPRLSHSVAPFCPVLRSVMLAQWDALPLATFKRFCRAFFANSEYDMRFSSSPSIDMKMKSMVYDAILRQPFGADQRAIVCREVTIDNVQATVFANVIWDALVPSS